VVDVTDRSDVHVGLGALELGLGHLSSSGLLVEVSYLGREGAGLRGFDRSRIPELISVCYTAGSGAGPRQGPHRRRLLGLVQTKSKSG
jgi:hypothetical protein